jgi:anti-sigma regulatory factor (Ser/Thr protein kinase)
MVLKMSVTGYTDGESLRRTALRPVGGRRSMDNSTHERTFEADALAVRGAREFAIEALADGMAVADVPGLVERVQLVVSELATNAVLHGRSEFVLQVSGGDDTVRVAVFDGGPGRPERGTMDPTAVTGRGLGIVESLALDWGVDPADGGKWVWAELAVAEPER